MTFAAPAPGVELEADAARPKPDTVGVREGGWFVRVVIFAVVVFWLVPVVGVLVTSFRPEANVDSIGLVDRVRAPVPRR